MEKDLVYIAGSLKNIKAIESIMKKIEFGDIKYH